jgi:hypothetical protein
MHTLDIIVNFHVIILWASNKAAKILLVYATDRDDLWYWLRLATKPFGRVVSHKSEMVVPHTVRCILGTVHFRVLYFMLNIRLLASPEGIFPSVMPNKL